VTGRVSLRSDAIRVALRTEFGKLWAGQTLSLLGSMVPYLAFPLTAIMLFHAGAFEVGVLNAMQYTPYLLFGLVAGVWVDRLRRRPIMIVADLSRALLMASVPVAALAGWLSIWYLCGVAFAVGGLTLFFDIAYQSYLPTLLPREDLTVANGMLETSRSVAQTGGPAIGGILVQLLTSTVALYVTAVGYLASGLFILQIRATESPQAPSARRDGMASQIRSGLGVAFGNPILRPIGLCMGTGNFMVSGINAILVLYAVRELHISAALVGVVYAVAGSGAVAGSMLAAWLAQRLGIGRAIVWSVLVSGVGLIVAAVPVSPPLAAVGALMLGRFLFGFGLPIFNIAQISLRQALVPDRFLGRVNASFSLLIWGVLPLGALLGGGLGTWLGLRPALLILSAGYLLAFAWVLLSPVGAVTAMPQRLELEEAVQA
jgi:MFS family permease